MVFAGIGTKAGSATVKLDTGAAIQAGLPEGAVPKGHVSVVVRPEHASLTAAGGKADLAGTLDNIVYFGTDTHYHVKLDGGGSFIIRRQNSHRAGESHAIGDHVGIGLEDSAAQVLRD